MTWRLEYHPEFDADLEDIGQWLEAQQRGLGEKFIAELELGLRRMQERPELYRTLEGGYRRILLRRFKVVVPYWIDGDTVWVIGVLHGSRDMERWLKRRMASEEE